jgi:hypothetical protein
MNKLKKSQNFLDLKLSKEHNFPSSAQTQSLHDKLSKIYYLSHQKHFLHFTKKETFSLSRFVSAQS